MNNITEHLNYNAFLYQQSVLGQFEDICQPLFRLDIRSFDYFKIFADGRYLRLINNLDFSKTYFLNIKDNGCFFTEKINKAQKSKSQYFIADNIKKFDKNKDPILHLLYEFNMWNSLHIYKKSNLSFIECYIFQMNREDTEFSEFYLNNLSLLENFCNYFNDRAEDIIDCSDQQKLAYFDQQFNFYHTAKKDLRAQQIQQFLQEAQSKKRNLRTGEERLFFSREETGAIKYLALGKSIAEISKDLDVSPSLIETSLQNLKSLKSNTTSSCLQASLSPRQQECLFLLTRGKTAKQTARILGIDYRTVHTHIDLLKSKLNCHTKEQLIEKAFESGFAYSVPQSIKGQ